VFDIREVWLVPGDKKVKAEDAIKKDDLVGRQSIKVKDASMYSKEKGFFFVVDGSEKAIHKADELLKEFGSKYAHKNDVLAKLDKEEDEANSAFGFILGG
jgi:hypothetical protein